MQHLAALEAAATSAQTGGGRDGRGRRGGDQGEKRSELRQGGAGKGRRWRLCEEARRMRGGAEAAWAIAACTSQGIDSPVTAEGQLQRMAVRAALAGAYR